MESNQESPRDYINRVNAEMQAENIAPGLNIGEKAPNFTLLDQTGTKVELYTFLKKGPIILSFYRGDWCGFCRKELIELMNVLPKITSLGATLLSIAPQSPVNAKKLAEKLNILYPLLSDQDMQVIKDYKIHFTLPKKMQEIYENNFNLNLPELTKNRSWELPVPATFIIDKTGVIKERVVEMDYKIRMSTDSIILALQAL